jgi:RHS repeat-associated protein
VAPPLDRTVAATFGASIAFLYAGPTPIQYGVAPGTIVPGRAAVLRGTVHTRDGLPVEAVTITVVGHPEFGLTRTRTDGMFDIAVNGGSPLVVDYVKTGFLPAQRQVAAPWADFAMVPDVVLVPLDPAVIMVDLTAPSMQVARGTMSDDADGQRQATLLVPLGTNAAIVMPDGSMQPASALHIRATEYTVGASGPSAMPGDLPPSSGYTYAVEYSSDEALAAGAVRVSFSQPLFHYVENFLALPVGTHVPAAFYDRAQGAWVPIDDGQVVKIVSITAGHADVDTDGDGSADAGLGIGDDERAELAALYTPGQSLWRVPITHFSSIDLNFPFGAPPGAGPPPAPSPSSPHPPDPDDKPCDRHASIIECQNRTLGEDLRLTGLPFRLHYRSDRAFDRVEARTLEIPVSGASVPAPLVRIELDVTILGREFQQTLPPAPNQTATVVWDGLDAFGRLVQGVQSAHVRIGYVYHGSYQNPAGFRQSFAALSGTPLGVNVARMEITSFRDLEMPIGYFDARPMGLGGWTLGIHHALDVAARRVELGDGTRRSAGPLVTIDTVAGGNFAAAVDGVPAKQSSVPEPLAVAAAPDGGYYIGSQSGLVLHVDPTGFQSVVAGGGVELQDEVPGKQSLLGNVYALAVGPDGSVYIGDVTYCRLRRLAPDGIIHTVAGQNRVPLTISGCQHAGDGGPATASSLDWPDGVAVAPDGTIYVAEGFGDTIRRIGPDGIVTTITAPGNRTSSGDGGPVSQAHFFAPYGLAVGPDGSLYVVDAGGSTIRRIGPDGIVTTVAGNGIAGDSGDGDPATSASISPLGVAVSPDGVVYESNQHTIRAIGPDGIIRAVAGGPTSGFSGDGGPASLAQLEGAWSLALAPDHSLLLVDVSGNRIRRIASSLHIGTSGLESLVVPGSGREVWVFDPEGRHLQTLDALTQAIRWQFTYDAQGRLATLVDGDGNTTTIERDGTGTLTGIRAPGGQRTALALDPNGFLATVTDPLNDVTQLQHTAGGLLTDLTDPKGDHHHFVYDAQGRLQQDQDGAGGVLTVDAVDGAEGRTVTITTALGRTSSYTTGPLPDGRMHHRNVDPSGAETTVDVGASEDTETATYPDGRTVTLQQTGDPRFGFLLPSVQNLVAATPAGLTMTVATERTAALQDPSDPFSFQTITSTVTRNGNAATAVYTAASRTLVSTSAAGRQRTTVVDAKGRLASTTLAPGVDPIVVGRDAAGRIDTLTWGAQSSHYIFDGAGRIASRTDATGATVHWGYDSAGRTTSLTTAGGRVYRFTFDANGNPASVTMPSGAVHQLTYTALNLPADYTPPGNAPYTRTYDVDGAPMTFGLPGGRSAVHAYDVGGRPASITTPEAVVDFGYAPADPTDRVATLTRTPIGGGTAQQVAFAYDGDLITKTEFTGVAAGRFDVTWSNDLLPVSVALTSAADMVTTALAWDADRLIAGVEPFTITRDGPGGAPTRIDDGTFRLDLSYDSLARAVERTVTIGGTTVDDLVIAYDAAGRIAQRSETFGGTTHTSTYAYDLDGQLLEVDTDGVAAERYTYDVNGNRTSRQLGAAPAVTAGYDAEDRLLAVGATTYAFDVDGMLATRGADTFGFGARRDLLTATLPGQAVTYDYDGFGRRVGRTDAAGTTQYLYGGVMDALALSASRDPAGTLTVYYYDTDGYLLALRRGATWWYVTTDQVGSPRAVFDATGALVERITYDAFGAQLEDTNPAFGLAIGYAGGLRDPATGLVHFGARDYDPAAGRWTSRDPALYRGRQANLYAYVDNDPASRRDPSGLWCIGASGYDTVGAGGQYCHTKNGWSLCAESGFGVGNSLEFTTTPEAGALRDPDAPGFGIADDVLDTTAELKGGCGPFQFGVNGSLDRCMNGNCGIQLGFGQVDCRTGDTNVTVDPTKFLSPKCEVEGKIAARSCLNSLDF